MDSSVIPDSRYRRLNRPLWGLMMIVLGIGAVVVPQAQAGKKKRDLPDASFAVAAFEETEGRVGIAVKVQNADAVSVTYAGNSRDAVKVIPANFWWDTEFDGVAQTCYRITVRATNANGTIERRLGAGLLGTEGCADCGDAEAKVGRMSHKVKRARRVLRRADSKLEKRVAKRRLARATKRLNRAQANLDACLAG